MTPPSGREALVARIRRFQAESLTGATSERFEALAADAFSWQRAHSAVASALTEQEPHDWSQIPFVPVDLFKQLPVGTVPEGLGLTFRTSGTTVGARGEHRIWTPELYDDASVAWARTFAPALPGDVVALLLEPAEHPDSSLSHMVRLFPKAPGTATWHLVDGRVDRDSLHTRLLHASGPVLLASTAFALADWLDGEVVPLPPGSTLMVTGGFKGRVTRLDDAGLYAEARARLQPADVLTEYGMTELSSQLWGRPGTPFLPPPWLRALTVDPQSGAPTAAGARGQLRFFDLANLDSALGIETLDEGSVDPTGAITLHGRLSGAEARGCSLTVEDAWTRDR